MRNATVAFALGLLGISVFFVHAYAAPQPYTPSTLLFNVYADGITQVDYTILTNETYHSAFAHYVIKLYAGQGPGRKLILE